MELFEPRTVIMTMLSPAPALYANFIYSQKIDRLQRTAGQALSYQRMTSNSQSRVSVSKTASLGGDA